jgi:hypothetical protein
MDTTNYFDLTIPENDIEQLTINEHDHFDCNLVNANTGEAYKGFILAKSPQGNNLTVCDTEFKRSGTDDKYQPRLIFRRVDDQFIDVNAPSSSRSRRIPFSDGADGYREFWKMVAFLFKFKETIDFGDFDGTYQVISADQFKDYMNNSANKDEVTRIANELGVDISEILRSTSTLTLLKSYRQKLQGFIDSNASETDVQNWIDEDDHKFRQQRCLIFGLEYIDFKREGSVNSKNFDVLTRVGSKYIDHVVIELKSPSDNIFEVTTADTINEPTGTYKIHKQLSRAIPQILEYKSALESKQPGDAELEKLGIFKKPYIGKCIIVIGKHTDNPRWLLNRENLVRSLNSGLEIWTYTELLNKLDATIQNLERIKESETEIDPTF